MSPIFSAPRRLPRYNGDMDEATRRERAEARRHRMTIRRAQWNELDPDVVRGAAAVSLAASLSRECWALAGLDFPAYSRAEIPIRFVPR